MLQYTSTAVGFAALALWIGSWYRKTAILPEATPPPGTTSHVMLALVMLVIAIVGGLVRAMVLVGVPRDFNSADRFMAFVGVTMLAVGFWKLLVYSVAMTVSQTQFKVKSRLRA